MEFNELVHIMARLRSQEGCPWDRQQTHRSLIPYLIEESYEVIEAIEEADPEKIKEELGDVLFQIVFHARLAQERDEFDMKDVIEAIYRKMVSRHPHVFADATYNTAEEVLHQWHERKKEEGKLKESALEGIPPSLPALLRAYRIQKRAARVGFDWQNIEGVLAKLDEEMAEFREAVSEGSRQGMEEEFGDLLFTLVNLSRFIGVNPEEAARRATQRFIQRFVAMEQSARRQGREFAGLSMEEMDRLWEEAKGKEKEGKAGGWEHCP